MNIASASLVDYTEAEEVEEKREEAEEGRGEGNEGSEEEEEKERRRKMAARRLIGRWSSTLASNSKLTMKHPARKSSGTREAGKEKHRIKIKQDAKKKEEKKRKAQIHRKGPSRDPLGLEEDGLRTQEEHSLRTQ